MSILALIFPIRPFPDPTGALDARVREYLERREIRTAEQLQEFTEEKLK